MTLICSAKLSNSDHLLFLTLQDRNSMEGISFYLIFSPAWVLISFLLYWPVFFRHIEEGEASRILSLRYYGTFLFGIIPMAVIFFEGSSVVDTIGLGLHFSEKLWIWLFSLLAGFAMACVRFFASKSEGNLKEYPQIREKNWSVGLAVNNIFSWTVYVIAYEFLFRGVLLFPLVPEIGFWPAAVFGTVLYSLSHYPKHLREAIGAIPFGLLLAWIAWETKSVWPAVWIHLCLAVSSSVFSFKHHPEMQIRSKNTK